MTGVLLPSTILDHSHLTRLSGCSQRGNFTTHHWRKQRGRIIINSRDPWASSNPAWAAVSLIDSKTDPVHPLRFHFQTCPSQNILQLHTSPNSTPADFPVTSNAISAHFSNDYFSRIHQRGRRHDSRAGLFPGGCSHDEDDHAYAPSC